MAKFKKGDRVRATRNISLTPVKAGAVGTVDDDNDDCPYVIWDGFEGDNRWPALEETELELLNPSWDNLQVGDILIDDDGDEHRVLGVCGEIIFVSDSDDHRESYLYNTAYEFQQGGWTIKGSEPTTTELTMADIEQKLEMAPGTLRVKKD